MSRSRRPGPRFALLGLVLLAFSSVPGALPDGWPDPPPVSAEAYALVDASTGQVLAAHRADERRPVASTVKLLTALTVLEHASPDDTVEVGTEVVGIGGASTGLRPGERYTVDELLAALLVRSGNDAAMALAIHVGGTLETFLHMMEERAEALGLEGLVLASPSGLDDRNRLSAAQLATIARAAHADPTIRRVAAAASLTLDGRRRGANRNLLLGAYEGATGLKTGYTLAAGWSLVGSAERDGRALVAVVLGAAGPDARFADAAALLDHGFAAFAQVSAAVEVTLRTGRGEVGLAAGPRHVVVPATDPALTLSPLLFVEVPEDPGTVTVSWQGTELAELEVTIDDRRRPAADGGAAIGRYLVDRLHAGVRGTLQGAGAATVVP